MANRFEDKRIDEALELLNAVARDKKVELQETVAGKYNDLRSLIGAFTDNVQERATDTYEAGKQKVADMATDVDLTVRRNPWAFIGGAAVFAYFFGYLMGRKRT